MVPKRRLTIAHAAAAEHEQRHNHNTSCQQPCAVLSASDLLQLCAVLRQPQLHSRADAAIWEQQRTMAVPYVMCYAAGKASAQHSTAQQACHTSALLLRPGSPASRVKTAPSSCQHTRLARAAARKG
jgi:hypothetical protein